MEVMFNKWKEDLNKLIDKRCNKLINQRCSKIINRRLNNYKEEVAQEVYSAAHTIDVLKKKVFNLETTLEQLTEGLEDPTSSRSYLSRIARAADHQGAAIEKLQDELFELKEALNV